MTDAARLYRMIEPELQDGEDVVWLDRPNPLHAARPKISRGIFGVVFFAFALFWTLGVMAESGAFGVVGLPFVVAGAWMMSAPWQAYRRARATVYAITDRRALIVVNWPRHSARRFEPRQIAPPDVRDHGDGTGDVYFYVEQVRTGRGRHTRRRGFLGVAEPHRVADALHRIRNGE